MKKIILFISLICIWQMNCGQYDSQINALFSQTQSGDGTYYGYTSGGSCTLDPTPPSGLSDKNAAINSPQYFGFYFILFYFLFYLKLFY